MSPGPSSTATEKPGSARSKLACAACRSNKVRCLRNEGLDYACMRCLRYGLACTPPAVNKRRGRPRRTSGNDNDTMLSYTTSPTNASSSTVFNPSLIQPMHVGFTNPLVTNTHTTHFTTSVLNPISHSPNDRLLNGNKVLSNSSQQKSTNRGPSQDGALLQSGIQASPLSSDVDGNGTHRMILSTSWFHDRLNPLVAVLDPKLHTIQHLRNTSTVLFSAVLTAASRFARPELHNILLSHTQTLLNRAINGGAAEAGIVQTIMILVYWKLPADTSAWRKIGIAIRIGYQLYWHVPRTQRLPDDEMAARKILNVERTWMCFDRGLSQTYGLPVAIQPNHMMDALTWAREHTYLGPSVDVHLASSIELCRLKDQWRAICESTFHSSAYSETALENIHAQCEALLRRYWRKEDPPPGFDYEKEHVGLWATLDFMLTLKRHQLETAPNDPYRVDACLSYASRITDEIDAVANNGDLEIMQDTSSIMASSLTVLMRKIFHLASVSQKLLIINLLQRILASYTRASGTELNTAQAYVARFVQRTLRAIGMESQAGSPLAREVVNGDNIMGTDDQPDFMTQLQELMMIPDEPTGTNDEDYW
ncbi:uncharacterized protein IL334_006900 [Kwoniella shivajii]|uniref:Zn(2)-C6 fungal-type domain-containing protein n=1 Tax=Kwoniella shivajii TaxID=564305 RepID=A0ABZ1D794_9TREE|nr:hypothetical protein IL334_006900 [Kwoniella shivajii]